MPWTAKTRAAAWRRVNAEPDTPRSVIAAELGVSAKALRDLIKEKECETGTQAKRVKRGRPLLAEPRIPLDFLEVARSIARDKVDREKLRGAIRRRMRRKQLRHSLPRYPSEEERLVNSITSLPALTLLLRFTGHPAIRREVVDNLDFEIGPALWAVTDKGSLARQLEGVPGKRIFAQPDGGVRIFAAGKRTKASRLTYAKWSEVALGFRWLTVNKGDPDYPDRAKQMKRATAEGRKLRDGVRRLLRKMRAGRHRELADQITRVLMSA